MADEEAKDGTVVEFDGEAECGKEGRVENWSNQKTIRPERRKIHMGADRPGLTRPKYKFGENRSDDPDPKGRRLGQYQSVEPDSAK